tara:strand:+ start:153 stop:1277 length:1125 start_codon:yes stop_codon:yes gene_type:complete
LKNSIKKILIAHSSNDNYGASKVLISSIDIFIKNGFKVYLILPNNGPLNNNKIIKKTNLKIINVGVFRKKYFNFFGLIDRLYYIIKSSLHIKNFLKNNNVDLVYINTSTIISPSIAAKLIGIPSIYHIHEIPKGSAIYVKFIVLFLNNFARNIICVSKSVKEFWINHGLKKNKLKIIYNGFNFKNYKYKNLKKDKIVFTCISRIIPYKGHLILVELFDKICKINNKIYLQIVGDTLPEYQKYLEILKLNVGKKGLSDKIIFMGFQEDISSILSVSNFFIHTPIEPDPLPTVIFEAIKSRTPVITNDLGGAYEILNDGKYGLFINNDLKEEASNKILKYLNSHEAQKDNINKALIYASNKFSKEKFERKILKIIE